MKPKTVKTLPHQFFALNFLKIVKTFWHPSLVPILHENAISKLLGTSAVPVRVMAGAIGTRYFVYTRAQVINPHRVVIYSSNWVQSPSNALKRRNLGPRQECMKSKFQIHFFSFLCLKSTEKISDPYGVREKSQFWSAALVHQSDFVQAKLIRTYLFS